MFAVDHCKNRYDASIGSRTGVLQAASGGREAVSRFVAGKLSAISR